MIGRIFAEGKILVDKQCRGRSSAQHDEISVSVSVSFEEIEKINWDEKVYLSNILSGKGRHYNETEYNPFK
jgi:hypothetical protein